MKFEICVAIVPKCGAFCYAILPNSYPDSLFMTHFFMPISSFCDPQFQVKLQSGVQLSISSHFTVFLPKKHKISPNIYES